MRHLASAILVAGLAIAPAASAQDFLGGLARGAAQSAAERLAARAVQAVTQPRPPVQPARPAPQAPVVSDAAADESTANLPSSDAPRPVPVNLSSSLRSPGEFKFSPSDEAAKKAFEDFGKVRCSSCEGGYSFDTWAQHQIPGMFGKLDDHLWGMAVGDSLRWTGSGGGGAYSITVASEHPVNGFPCKQLDYSGQRGTQSAGYRGLTCRSQNGGSVSF